MFSRLLKRAWSTPSSAPPRRTLGRRLFTAIASTLVFGGAAFRTGYAKAHACGIVGYVGDDQAVDYLVEGLSILQNRGYDSAGISTVDTKTQQLVTTKFASVGTSDSITRLKLVARQNHAAHQIGISHTRWATHGGKSDENAHPHWDCKKRIALVHNGTIENSASLKTELENRGIAFRSQTDTEVVAQLIGLHLDQNLSLMDATKKSLQRLEGTWGLCIISKDVPGQIIAARNGSPLVIGIGENRMFVASEVAAFSRHTQNYISLKDGEIAVLNSQGTNIDLSRMEKAPMEEILTSPAPYPNWTLKEIMEQPEAIARSLNYGGRLASNGFVKLGGLESSAKMLLGIRMLAIAGCGTSLFAGMYGMRLMRWLHCFDAVYAIDSAEVGNDSLPLGKDAGLLAISQSGETKDTQRAVIHAENQMIPRFSIVNQVGSLIARTTRCGVYLNAGREHAVASTKAFTTQVTALAMIAAWYSQHRENANQDRLELVDSIHRLPVYAGIALKVHAQCKALVEKLKGADHIFILGKGFAEPIAHEGALKIKEIGYCHAEGYSGGALKHGTFALIKEGTPVILLIFDDQHADLMRITAHETKARGAFNIVLTDKATLASDVAHEVLVVPANGPLTALLAVIPLQFIAYELSMIKQITVDTPRNLAKTVTVD